jgi:ABC-2 type transport system ATP-binding protein
MGSTAGPGSALRIRGLSKAYLVGHLRRKPRPALKALDLDVERGEVFGFLGPNGSGKTTTLKLLMGLVFPDAGDAEILGYPIGDRRWKYHVGYLPEHPYLYDYLTPREYLDYVGRLLGMSAQSRRQRAADLLEQVGLGHARDLALRRFSKGMVQRAGLAQALMNDPEMVFLDEPMSGLDPVGRRLVRDLILDMKARGKTVFFSTHILSDAETLCDRVAVLRGGVLLEAGRLDDILRIDVAHLEVLASGLSAAAAAALPHVRARHAVGERWRLEVAEEGLAEAVTAITRDGGRILSVLPIRQSLEEHFMREMGPGQPAGAGVLGE